ncbi:type IV pilin N-terminal domain-containing protein [Natronolimnohabitans innermongolicus]|uniref:Archaeal Type IV pilin N-terminal domain-containing protein n=1 Tax=Natronolimnohabitans innermongolicus JCM 12255 TaxID=1227499 RepID=L9WW31_9EURY|nr:type IV pilin N-terminal domain-containing protein [Natronolimnohabitans innermongolicus]ELY53617.1 hypothetical protein C493_13913 [Natronolimnohabitans innermongolicus JCM 12255]
MSADAPTPTASPARAISPVIGAIALLAIVVATAATVAVGLGYVGDSLVDPGPNAAFDLEADADRSTLAIEHVAGDDIDVESLAVYIAVDGERLEHQPPVPFVGAEGFNGTPSGAFNPETDSEWRVGETVRLQVAENNDPEIRAGETVSVTLAVDDSVVAELEETAN